LTIKVKLHQSKRGGKKTTTTTQVLLRTGFVKGNVFSGAFPRNMYTANKDKGEMRKHSTPHKL